MRFEDKWVPIEVHPRFVGGIKRLADEMGWRMRSVGGVDHVCLEERYQGRTPALLTPVQIAEGRSPERVDTSHLARWMPLKADPGIWALAQKSVTAGLASGDNVDWLGALQLVIDAAPEEELPLYLKDAMVRISAELPDSSLWAVEIEPRLRNRLTGARVLFGSVETPEVLSRDPFEGFPAAAGLHTTVILGYEAFVEVPLIASSPWVRGVSAARPGGALVLLFGTALAGIRRERHMLELLRSRALDEATLAKPARDEIPAREFETAFQWWVSAMNEFLSVLTDPARYRDARGFFDPRPLFAAILTFERLSACVQTELLYVGRDEFVRKTLMFDALDLLEGLGAGPYRKTARISEVEGRLEDLRGTLPKAANQVFMPRCQGALDALKATADGFVLRERRTVEGIRVKTKKGAWQEVPVETALADYLWVLRNSTHSFRETAREPREVSLLGAHDARLPSALADLPFLHFLWLLTNPTALRT